MDISNGNEYGREKGGNFGKEKSDKKKMGNSCRRGFITGRKKDAVENDIDG